MKNDGLVFLCGMLAALCIASGGGIMLRFAVVYGDFYPLSVGLLLGFAQLFISIFVRLDKP